MKKITFILFIMTVFFIQSSQTFAERKYLQPPETSITFNKKKYIRKEYKEQIKKIKELLKNDGDPALIRKLDLMENTYDKEAALNLISELNSAKQLQRKLDQNSSDVIDKEFKRLEELIINNRIHNNSNNVDVRVDNNQKEYVVSWDKGGARFTKSVPMVPEMNLRVKGELIGVVNDNIKTKKYQYYVWNGVESKGSFVELYCESKFPNTFFKDFRIPGFQVDEYTKQSTNIPGGYLNYFIFRFYNINDEIIVKHGPGAEMDNPFTLIEIDNTLPGIISCYIPVYEFKPYKVLNPREVPEAAMDIFTTQPDTRTRYMYQAKTIGPVPEPTDYNASEFIRTIIRYNNESIEQGWIDNNEVAAYITGELTKIQNNLRDNNMINDFLVKLDEYYSNEMILSEAYALLKYNLEYMLLQ